MTGFLGGWSWLLSKFKLLGQLTFFTVFLRFWGFLAGLCGGESCRFFAWFVWWLAVSRLTCVVASHAVLTWRAGEGGGLILPALAKSAPTLPSPPRHPGTARCAACGYAGRNAGCLSCSRVSPYSGQAHTGSHGQGVSRSDNLCSQCAEDGSPLVRAQSEVTPPQPGQTNRLKMKLCACSTIAPGSVQLWKDNPIFPFPICRKRLCPILQS